MNSIIKASPKVLKMMKILRKLPKKPLTAEDAIRQVKEHKQKQN